MSIILWIVIIVLAIIVIWLIAAYNKFIVTKNRAKNAWSQIDVQLKRRNDLIPNLVNAVKGYMKHEKGVLTEVTNARAAIMSAKTPAAMAKGDNMLSGALKSLFAVSENYPQLKANENFMQLQEELSGTESKIAYARQFYNDSVLVMNTLVESFPSNIIAGMFHFVQMEFFKTEESERKNVKVEF
ncbi:MAG: LemA family protein [Candidatus Woesearchaeota archaeon]